MKSNSKIKNLAKWPLPLDQQVMESHHVMTLFFINKREIHTCESFPCGIEQYGGGHGSIPNPDTMYWHKVMQQPNQKQLLEAVKEVNDQTKNGNWEVFHHIQVPPNASFLPAEFGQWRERDESKNTWGL